MSSVSLCNSVFNVGIWILVLTCFSGFLRSQFILQEISRKLIMKKNCNFNTWVCDHTTAAVHSKAVLSGLFVFCLWCELCCMLFSCLCPCAMLPNAFLFCVVFFLW